MFKLFTLFIGCFMSLLWLSCDPNKTPKEILGYAPVYADPSTLAVIKSEAPRSTENGGKIYQYESYTFQIENGKGVHIINSSNPSAPVKLGFISVLGCSEISIQNNILYTNNLRDLVSIDISNINDVKVKSRIEKIFPDINQETPPHSGVYFECVDPLQGTVIGWTEQLLYNPKCKK